MLKRGQFLIVIHIQKLSPFLVMKRQAITKLIINHRRKIISKLFTPYPSIGQTESRRRKQRAEGLCSS